MVDANGDKNFLTAHEISEYFCIPLNTIYRLSKSGKIKGIKVGKQWRYSKADIEKILAGGIDLSQIHVQDRSEFQERRAYPRMNCNFPCRYMTNTPSEFGMVPYGYIKNISGNGVFLHDAIDNLAHVNIDDPIDFVFDFVSDTEETKSSIPVKGRIVRKTPEGVGVKFRKIDDKYKELITNYVN